MIAIVAYDRDGGFQEGVPADRLPELLKTPGKVIWVDLLAPTREEAAILTSVFGFHPLALEDCETRRQHPKVDGYESYVFLLTHGVHPESSMREFRTRQLALFIGANYLVTYHREKSRSVEATLALARANPRLLDGGPGWILYSVLDLQVDQYLPLIENFEKKVNEIEERCFSATTSAILQEVFDLRKALIRMRRISGHQRDVLARLTRREFKEIDDKSAMNMRDILDHLVRVNDLADSYRELMAGAVQAHLSIVSNRTNEIMRVLTLTATIFIPLTFIAGLYGMNFKNQPEYEWEYGYLFALLLMGTVAAGTYFYFRRIGVLGERERLETAARRRRAGANNATPSAAPAPRSAPARGGARAAAADSTTRGADAGAPGAEAGPRGPAGEAVPAPPLPPGS